MNLYNVRFREILQRWYRQLLYTLHLFPLMLTRYVVMAYLSKLRNKHWYISIQYTTDY